MSKSNQNSTKFDKIFLLRIFLLIISALLFLFGLWGIFENTNYLKSLIEQGQLDSIGFNYDIVQFYSSNCGQYFVYSILVFISTFSLPKKFSLDDSQSQRLVVTEDEQFSQLEKIQKDEEIDEWLTEMMKKDKI